MNQNTHHEICIINGISIPLETVREWSLKDFWLFSKALMPRKLYKYCPDMVEPQSGINYSRQNFISESVYLQSPDLFDDIYDSRIKINYEDFELDRLRQYCSRIDISLDNTDRTDRRTLLYKLAESLNGIITGDNESRAFVMRSEGRIARLHNRRFLLIVQQEILNGISCEEAIIKTLHYEYYDLLEQLKTAFRVSCFACTPYSQMMWALYANKHCGFCIEYSIQKEDKQYQVLYDNLFPVIYSRNCHDAPKVIIHEADSELSQEKLNALLNSGVLMKNIDWSYQSEWRLIIPKGASIKDNGYLIPFYPISKIYIGCRMSYDDKIQLVDLCDQKGIPYIEVVPKDDEFIMTDRIE